MRYSADFDLKESTVATTRRFQTSGPANLPPDGCRQSDRV